MSDRLHACVDCGAPTDGGWCSACLDIAPARIEQEGRIWLDETRFIDAIPVEGGGWKVMLGDGNSYSRHFGDVEA